MTDVRDVRPNHIMLAEIKDELAQQRVILDALAASLRDLKAALIGTDKPQILPDWNKWHN